MAEKMLDLKSEAEVAKSCAIAYIHKEGVRKITWTYLHTTKNRSGAYKTAALYMPLLHLCLPPESLTDMQHDCIAPLTEVDARTFTVQPMARVLAASSERILFVTCACSTSNTLSPSTCDANPPLALHSLAASTGDYGLPKTNIELEHLEGGLDGQFNRDPRPREG